LFFCSPQSGKFYVARHSHLTVNDPRSSKVFDTSAV
jgi:hypothetical protein